MNPNLLRNLSFYSRRLRHSPFNHRPNSIPSPLSLFAPTFFSSINDPSPFTHTQKKHDPVDVEDISNEEFKRRVAKLQDGDAEAIPSVFEGILQRSLTGKPIEADKELMKEILGKGTGSEEEDDDDDDDDDEDYELDSDLEGMSDIDYEDKEVFDLDFKGRSGPIKKRLRDE
ncbi:histone chaperone RTT106 [Gastrolobium bilobum]|uniref:histone chaperone RTT106 n=1 Tax=Gastrolobium bilobum TaxID=150636 RepID=UPI002AB0C9A4|nr:histone chaperone RTT106 [Gastrolobium bilobum]